MVIRVSKACNIIHQSRVIKEVLKRAIKILHLKIEVCINAENKKEDTQEVFIFPKHLKMALKRIGDRTKPNDITLLEFSDVLNIPMIMIIVERGRMGDTFPANCMKVFFLGFKEDVIYYFQNFL